MVTVVASAPGRVNLIGEHTDTTLGWCLPMAIDRRVEITYQPEPESSVVHLTSDQHAEAADIPLTVTEPSAVNPSWARYVAGVVAQVRPTGGGSGRVRSNLPAGVGLSSSAALEVACALALGPPDGDRVALARLCQAAEHAARGVPTGLLDQLASISGVADHAILLDCTGLTTTPVALPPDLEIAVVPGTARDLEQTGYARRLDDLHLAERVIGPLREAALEHVARLSDPTIRRRARHVVTENQRVLDMVAALTAGDLPTVGELIRASHRSLRDDYECSLPAIDNLCDELDRAPGVLGARILGAGWGGSVLAVGHSGALGLRPDTLVVTASDGARRWTSG